MSRASKVCAGTVGLGLALTLGACLSPQVGSPCPIPEKATDAQRKAALAACYAVVGETTYQAKAQKDVDILFLIDNSRSMSPKQRALAANIPKFIQKIEGFKANYHVAVATSDVGTTPSDGFFWTNPDQAECNTFKGPAEDGDGRLQVMPCSQRTSGSSEAKNACAALCTNPTFANRQTVTTDGARYISNIEGKTNVPSDMQLDTMTGKMVDVGPSTAFKCMALVGDRGCGMEAQLEGAKRAMDGHNADNKGFLRDHSVVAVIFITDEEDCSIQMARRAEAGPPSRDCSNPDQNASWECYNSDYRCVARSMQCDQAMNVQGAHTNCKERADSFLEPIKKYHDFFLNLVDDPSKLIISGIWTKPSVTEGGKLVVQRNVGGTTSAFLELAGGSDASCRYSGTDGNFTGVNGFAQRRLSAFADSFGTSFNKISMMNEPIATQFSICDVDNYSVGLDQIAKKIQLALDPNCLPVQPKTSAGYPVCLVGDVDQNTPEAAPDVLFPTCSTSCCSAWANAAQASTEDPTIRAACAAEGSDCFCAVQNNNVCVAKQGWVGGVWRKDLLPAPAGKVVSFRCAGTPL